MPDLIVARDGGWVLASNGISVSVIRGWGAADDVRRECIHWSIRESITDEEYAACVAWTFPPIHDIATYEGEGDARCRCGQWIRISWEDLPPDPDDMSLVQCAYCGRRYRVRLEEISDGAVKTETQ